MAAIPPEVRALLEAPNYVHLAVLLRDGAPMSMAVWCALEGEHVIISSSQDSPKVAAVRRDPRVALSVTDLGQPYRSAMLRGRVVAIRPDPDLRDMDPISHQYLGVPFPLRHGRQVTLVIEVEHARYLELPMVHAPGGSPTTGG